MVETRLRSSGLDRDLRRSSDERGAAEAAPSGLTADLWSSADLPEHAGPGTQDERPVARTYELAGRIGLAEVAHCAVFDEVGTIVWPELQIHRGGWARSHAPRPRHPPQEPLPQRRDDPEVQAASDRATMTTELPSLALFIRCRRLTRNASPELGQACG